MIRHRRRPRSLLAAPAWCAAATLWCAAAAFAAGAAAPPADPAPAPANPALPPAGPAPPPAGAPHDYVRVVDRAWRRVGFTVTAVDGTGRPARGLGRDDFRMYEDGAEVPIADFGIEGERADRPLSVAVLLDLSQSMGRQVRQVREAATALLGGLRPGDEIMVARFNDQVTVLAPFTGRIDDPEDTLRNLGPGRGGTALFRSIGEILRDLRERPGRKVVLVVSDGLDNDLDRGGHVLQSLALQDLLRLCFRSQTVVYGVRPGMTAASWLPFEGFVEETGGRLLYTGGDLERLFARLGEEFRAQYYLAYDTDPKARAGRRRSLRVEVVRPGVTVRALGGWSSSHGRLKTLLREALHDDPDLRSDAVYDLGFTDDPRAVRALRDALSDPEERIRRLAAAGLGRLRAGGALPLLVARLDDPADTVRRAAGDALIGFGPGAMPGLAEFLEGDLRRRPGPALIEAARVLGAAGDERACDPLGALLGGHPEAVRAAAAAALGDLGLLCGIPALRRGLADPAAAVRSRAARSIAAIAGAAARPILEQHLKREEDPSVRGTVEELLAAGADRAPGARPAAEGGDGRPR